MTDNNSSISSSPSNNESIDPGNDPIEPEHIVELELDGLKPTEYDTDDNDTISFNSQDSDWHNYYSDQDSDNEVQFKSGKQNDDPNVIEPKIITRICVFSRI